MLAWISSVPVYVPWFLLLGILVLLAWLIPQAVALRQSQARYRLITKNISDVLWIYNVTRKRITYVSPSTVTLRGFTVEETLEQSIEDCIIPEHLPYALERIRINVEAFIRDPSDERHTITQLKQPCKDGSSIWTELSTRLAYNKKNEIELIGVSRNIERRKRLEKFKEDMDRVINHDLRTPIAGIIGLAETIRDDANLTPEQQEVLDMILQSGNEALNMTHLNRVIYQQEQGSYTYKPSRVDLGESIRQSWHSIAASLGVASDRMSLSTDGNKIKQDPVMVLAEPLLLNLVLTNLLKNAIEASPDSEAIQVSLSTFHEGSNRMVRTEIFNYGVVPDSVRDRFFEKYASAGKNNGTGLGTYGAKLMVETMTGDIAMHSPENGGTRVEFTLQAG